MTANVCGKERRTRGIIGVLLIVVAFIVSGTIGWIVGLVGIALLLTAMFSYCPINTLAHRNSCRRSLVKDPFKNSRGMTNVNY